MKKIAALILLTALLVSLTACGGKPAAAENSEPTPPPATETPALETPAPETPVPTEDLETPTAAPVETPAEEPSSDLILGVYSEDSHTYENELIGIGCRLDADWYVYDEEEIAALNGMMIDMMTDEDIAGQLENGGYVQPFYAQKLGDDFATVNITIENLGLLYGALLDEQKYAELSVKQIPAALEGLGMTDINVEIGSAEFAGSEHTAIFVSAFFQDIEFYEVMVCVKADRYMASIAASSYFTNLTGEVLPMFYSLIYSL